MPPPPLQRRKSFWFGAFVLLFLGWASWHSFRKPHHLYGWNTGTHGHAVSRMEGATYLLRDIPAGRKGLIHETIGSLRPDNFTAHWRRMGIHVSRLPDAATATISIALWIAWLAWLERKGRNKEAIPSAPESLTQ